MKILITGCNGLLGQSLIRNNLLNHMLYGVDINDKSFLIPASQYLQCDMTKRPDMINTVLDLKPDWILNTAGFTNVDGAETDKDKCWQINVNAVENIVDAARKVKARVVHLSTDYIFDGVEGPYKEDEYPNPLGFYGRSKLAGENVLKGSTVDHAIVRTMVLYGHGNQVRPNFVSWLLEKFKNNESVNIVTDQIGNVTYIDDLAAGIWAIVEKNAFDIFNIAGSEITDRNTFAHKVARFWGFDTRLIKPMKTVDLHQLAPRPLNSGLIVNKAIDELGIKLSNIDEGLLKYKKYPEN